MNHKDLFKKTFLIPFMLLLSLAISACSSDPDNTLLPDNEQPGQSGNEEGDDEGGNTPGNNERYLVLFSSRSGNTEQMAQTIQSSLNCDILEVEPETPYDTDYNSMLERAQREQAAILQGNYPAIKTSVESFDKYDIIFIGYPIWYGHMATPMQTFLHNHADKLAGKRIALFATSGSSGISTSVSDARGVCANAIYTETLLLTSSTLNQMSTRISNWLEQLGATKENNTNNNEENSNMNIKMTVGNRTITATMENNATARDFLSRLPLEITLEDYNNITEKIYYPSPALNTENTPRGCTPVAGDITLYIPWGNIAIFCKNWSQSNDLIKLGHIDDNGIEILKVSGNVNVKIEKL